MGGANNAVGYSQLVLLHFFSLFYLNNSCISMILWSGYTYRASLMLAGSVWMVVVISYPEGGKI